MRTPFLGSAYSARSLNLACQRCVNLYPEMVETKSGKDVAAFDTTPGSTLLTTAGAGPIRGMEVMGGLLYVVSGREIYSITSGWTATLLGTMSNIAPQVGMITNNRQLAIFDQGSGYSVTASTGVVAPLNLPFTPAPIATYQDGFGLTVQANSQVVWQSTLGDLTSWNALTFSSVDGSADNISSIIDQRRELWVLKDQNTEVWVDAGNPNFSFQRLEGVFLQLGCVAPQSPALMGEGIAWLAQNAEGRNVVVMSQGYKAVRISTHAIEARIATYPTVGDAVGYSYIENGHVFYVITFPSGNETWVFDMITQSWHQRAALSGGTLNRHAANAFAYFSGIPVVGDYQSGNIYYLNPNEQTDNGAQRKWIRSWRALLQPNPMPQAFSSLNIDMQMGMGVPAGTKPNIMLRWSDDGGHNWTSEVFGQVGQTGATTKRATFRRLGATRRGTGLDRTFELSSTDTYSVALIGAELT